MRLDRMGSRGVGLALLAALLFGGSAPAAKGLLPGTSPQLLAGLLYLGSGGGLLFYWLVRRQAGEATEAPLERRDLPWLAGAIAAGGVIAPLLLMLGLTRTPASAASLLLNLEGVFTAGLAWVLFREHVHSRIVVGMLAIVAGGVLLSWEGRLAWGGVSGPLAVICACFAWGVDNNLTQKVSSSDPVQITMLKGMVAGGTNTGLALMLGTRWPDAGILIGALVVGFLGYGVSLVLYVRALRELDTARTGAYFSLAPFIGAAIAILAWLEPVHCRSFSPLQAFGLGLFG